MVRALGDGDGDGVHCWRRWCGWVWGGGDQNFVENSRYGDCGSGRGTGVRTVGGGTKVGELGGWVLRGRKGWRMGVDAFVGGVGSEALLDLFFVLEGTIGLSVGVIVLP